MAASMHRPSLLRRAAQQPAAPHRHAACRPVLPRVVPTVAAVDAAAVSKELPEQTREAIAPIMAEAAELKRRLTAVQQEVAQVGDTLPQGAGPKPRPTTRGHRSSLRQGDEMNCSGGPLPGCSAGSVVQRGPASCLLGSLDPRVVPPQGYAA